MFYNVLLRSLSELPTMTVTHLPSYFLRIRRHASWLIHYCNVPHPALILIVTVACHICVLFES